MKSSILCCAIVVTLSVSALRAVYGDSATWSSNPTSTDWRVAGNWMPATVPNCGSCVASFGASALSQVELFGSNGHFFTATVAQVTFTPGASAYTITAHGLGAVDFDGAGVVNQSGIQQNFKTDTEDGNPGVGQFFFSQGASAGTSMNTFTNGGTVTGGGEFGRGGACQFNDHSTAGDAMFVNEGGSRLDAGGGEVNFYFSSTAGNATIINGGATDQGSTGGKVYFESAATAGQCVIVNNGAENNGSGGRIFFVTGASAGSAQITNNGGTVSGAGGGTVSFSEGSDAGTATITNNGGTVAGARGAVLSFVDTSSANLSVLMANGGTNGGDGGVIEFTQDSRGVQTRVEVFGNGNLDISEHYLPSVRIGSLEGDGLVFLGPVKLVVGGNDLSTTFSGVIQDTGELTKIGEGTLTLSGANTYTGATTISNGVLLVSNRNGSGTGTGAVQVDAGTLGGRGIISGAVTVGTGTGAGAFLSPSEGVLKQLTLTIQSPLTFKLDGTYTYRLTTKRAKSDQVIANGVTIESGAQFDFQSVANKPLNAGTVFTAISNTSANPIAGTFANLPDGSTFTVGRNNYQVSYEGGGGNDLTLTIVP